jgi:hypothetical protein
MGGRAVIDLIVALFSFGCFAVACRMIYLLGLREGEQRGRDLQWTEDFIEAGRREQAKHRRNGQFKARGES